MKKGFSIYKHGKTENPVSILFEENDFTPCLISSKIQKYIYLGYSVDVDIDTLSFLIGKTVYLYQSAKAKQKTELKNTYNFLLSLNKNK